MHLIKISDKVQRLTIGDLDLVFKVTQLFLEKPCQQDISDTIIPRLAPFWQKMHLIKILEKIDYQWPWPTCQGHRANLRKTLFSRMIIPRIAPFTPKLNPIKFSVKFDSWWPWPTFQGHRPRESLNLTQNLFFRFISYHTQDVLSQCTSSGGKLRGSVAITSICPFV